MKIHEYQAREILSAHGVAVPRGLVASSAEQAREAAIELGGNVWAVKAQVHAGGRGKGGGVKIARSPQAVFEAAQSMLGSRLVTAQTGSQGARVDKVLIQEGVSIADEFYVGFLIDRISQRPVLLASSEGGMDIEKTAADSPDKIIQASIDPAEGLTRAQALDVANRLGLGQASEAATEVLLGLWRTFNEMDCALVEINPLVLTEGGAVYALDAKMTFDDNALYRHPELSAMHDPAQENPMELKAAAAGLQYIALDGNIACLVNGAGLAMATMDTIKLFGGEPANFLDVGGGASVEKVTAAFEIMLSSDKVKVILVNIFGGIMRCDTVAQGLVAACQHVKVDVPLVVRMKGTCEAQGHAILEASGLPIIVEQTLGQAAQRAVELSKEGAA